MIPSKVPMYIDNKEEDKVIEELISSSQESLEKIYPNLVIEYQEYVKTVEGIVEPMNFEDFVHQSKIDTPIEPFVPEKFFN